MANWIRTEDDELINLDHCLDIVFSSESRFSELYRTDKTEAGRRNTSGGSKTAGIFVTRYTQECLGGAPLYEYKCLLKSKDRVALLTAYQSLIHSLTPIESYLQTFDEETTMYTLTQRPDPAGKAHAPQATNDDVPFATTQKQE